jgi:hypothetical protein
MESIGKAFVYPVAYVIFESAHDVKVVPGRQSSACRPGVDKSRHARQDDCGCKIESRSTLLRNTRMMCQAFENESPDIDWIVVIIYSVPGTRKAPKLVKGAVVSREECDDRIYLILVSVCMSLLSVPS